MKKKMNKNDPKFTIQQKNGQGVIFQSVFFLTLFYKCLRIFQALRIYFKVRDNKWAQFLYHSCQIQLPSKVLRPSPPVGST